MISNVQLDEISAVDNKEEIGEIGEEEFDMEEQEDEDEEYD